MTRAGRGSVQQVEEGGELGPHGSQRNSGKRLSHDGIHTAAPRRLHSAVRDLSVDLQDAGLLTAPPAGHLEGH